MPLCVRSKSLHPLDVQSTSQAVVQRPSQKRIWTQQSITQPYATPSFPLDPALCGQAVTVVSGGSQNGLRVITSPMPYPTPVSHLAFIPPQFQNGGAIHLLSQQYIQGIDPRVDPRMLQRTHSNYGPATSSHPSDPHIVYDCQVTAADQRGQAIAWTTREVVLRSPPLPRQRSAKACKKCRKRKTKVCQSCTEYSALVSPYLVYSAQEVNHARAAPPAGSNANTTRSRHSGVLRRRGWRVARSLPLKLCLSTRRPRSRTLP